MRLYVYSIDVKTNQQKIYDIIPGISDTALRGMDYQRYRKDSRYYFMTDNLRYTKWI